MKKIKYISISIISLFLLYSCDNKSFIDDIYVEPKADFSIDNKSVFDVFESVHFTNTGEGQKFVIWTGDQGHVYGKTGNNGFACNADGTFSYSYQEPGDYTAVWIASSVKANGDITFSTDSVKISVKALNGGLASFSLPRLGRLSDFGSNFFYESYGNFVAEKRILCPIPYSLWPTYILRTVSAKFALESEFASLNWTSATGVENTLTSESTTKILRFDNNNKLEPQTLKVKTSSGIEESYEIAAIIIPEFTKFSINGVNATKTRDVSSFNKFNMEVDLPNGTDLKSLIPVFTVMNNDANLIDNNKTISVKVNNVVQTSGSSTVDFSTTVNYVIKYSIPGKDGYTYEYESYYSITVK